MEVPTSGRLRLEILAAKDNIRQGVSIAMSGGCILANGNLVPVLRTWADDDFESCVEYDYLADDGFLRTWNDYEVTRGGGSQEALVVEHWTGNAGLWIEAVSPIDHICHCSHGDSVPPDFENLVYRVTVNEFELA